MTSVHTSTTVTPPWRPRPACAGIDGRHQSESLADIGGIRNVDLNPVRAGIAATPEESAFTSIHARLRQARSEATSVRRAKRRGRRRSGREHLPPLLAFSDPCHPASRHISMTFRDYLQLLDWTGRRRPSGKHALMEELPPILARLQVDPQIWRRTMQTGGRLLGRALGRWERLQAYARRLGQSWIRPLRSECKSQPA